MLLSQQKHVLLALRALWWADLHGGFWRNDGVISNDLNARSDLIPEPFGNRVVFITAA